ncbi:MULTISPECIES: glutaredoxin 3 [Corallincola]|uniref:Glutaredoxin n=3 Tax=Corallincola TaxID=1775176 RepID=A0A368NL55_9GAMM|nr:MULTISPECIES: glutaredoxin 3 [Corallincola]RCU51168.1 glutaredoxin 3 [Corallincola holothuriorum]TAA45918.1 glutaredoxin 3 [Corallincola spongiicola]TCI04025.1 glutaredoxin 3 [Corallincola luteus]
MTEVVIYTTKWCPYCIRAKALLEKLSLSYQEIAVDGQPALREKMMELSGRHTVPQIFIDGTSIGGCDDLVALHNGGKLAAMLSR